VANFSGDHNAVRFEHWTIQTGVSHFSLSANGTSTLTRLATVT